jgi:hypothetical protein
MDTHTAAKLVFLLSTCHKLSDELFIRMIQMHESTKIACMKYYYDLEFTLRLTDSTYSQFDTVRVEESFLTDSNLSDNECAAILAELGPDATLVNLINIFSAAEYKYLFIPCTVDYGMDVGLIHQCGILIDLKAGLFLFYEPYGRYTYRQYTANYADSIHEYLDLFRGVLPDRFVENKRARFTTFHKYYGLSTGIQSIILEKNNTRGDEYDAKLAEAMTKLEDRGYKTERQAIESEIKNDKNPVNKTDRSIKILDILTMLSRYYPTFPDDIWYDLIELSHTYNAKSCVSITMIELNYLFSGGNMQEFYDQFTAAKYPSHILVQKMINFVENLDNVTKINKIITSTNNSIKQCKLLTD